MLYNEFTVRVVFNPETGFLPDRLVFDREQLEGVLSGKDTGKSIHMNAVCEGRMHRDYMPVLPFVQGLIGVISERLAAAVMKDGYEGVTLLPVMINSRKTPLYLMTIEAVPYEMVRFDRCLFRDTSQRHHFVRLNTLEK